MKTPLAQPEMNYKPKVIAEAGVNHEGSMELAKRLIHEAQSGGADAIKFQTYKADKIAAKDSPSYWDLSKESTTSQFELFKKYDGFWKKEYESLALECEKVGIEFMSTPFDVESAAFLNDLMSTFKVSSSDLTNLPFIDFLCDFGKPIILSTGASDLWEIQRAVSVIESKGNPLCLMHCVLNYPTPDEFANLSVIRSLREQFPQHQIGYSDHTLPKDMEVLRVATLLGAEVLEKHFTHDKSLPGNDHYHAMDLVDLKKFRADWERTASLLGSPEIKSLPSEGPARRNARRSLVANCHIKKGESFEPKHLTWKRPASGISPMHYQEVLGKVASRDIQEDEILQWGDVS
jgi:N-acetylneuraminate synthase